MKIEICGNGEKRTINVDLSMDGIVSAIESREKFIKSRRGLAYDAKTREEIEKLFKDGNISQATKYRYLKKIKTNSFWGGL